MGAPVSDDTQIAWRPSTAKRAPGESTGSSPGQPLGASEPVAITAPVGSCSASSPSAGQASVAAIGAHATASNEKQSTSSSGSPPRTSAVHGSASSQASFGSDSIGSGSEVQSGRQPSPPKALPSSHASPA